MKLSGKKQVNIREDNKSAVIHLLLQREFTLLQMSEQLNLSHTALAKVMRELMEKNVVMLKSSDVATTGRPPKIYSINGDCAIACAVVISHAKIHVYYFDMHGFQINDHITENTFKNFPDVLAYVQEQLTKLKEHPRLKDRVLKYVHIGIPTGSMFGMDFQTSAQLAHDYFETAWPSMHVEVNRNVDYEMTAEKTYGLLTGDHRNAVLLNFDEQPCASILIDSHVYHGDSHHQGLFKLQKDAVGAHAMYKAGVCKAYLEGDVKARAQVEKNFSPMLETLRTVLQFLDIHEVVISGEAKYFGDDFLTWMHTCLGENCKIRFSIMGKDVKPAVSGAVWLSTYSTLQDIITRS